MRWFRQNRVFGAEAALFALIVQFAVAFGHVHAAEANHEAAASAAIATLATDKTGAPASSDHGNPADKPCAICAIVHLTGSAQVAAAPTLPLPVAYAVAELSLSSESILDDLRCLDLRSRGPPQA